MWSRLKSQLKSLFFLSLAISTISINNLCLAQDRTKTIEKKTIERWTLQDWLGQKDRNRLMDQWLMLHTPTPYEFAIEVASLDYSVEATESTGRTQNKYKNFTGSFTAYATLVGLEFQNHNNYSEGWIDNTSFFHLRLLGSADQASHFTLSLGQKSRQYNNNSLPRRNQLLGQWDMTLYFNNHFGFSYFYRSYYPLVGDSQWGDLNGSEQTLNLFIDFEALRVFGGFFYQKESQTMAQQSSSIVTQGTNLGLRFYF